MKNLKWKMIYGKFRGLTIRKSPLTGIRDFPFSISHFSFFIEEHGLPITYHPSPITYHRRKIIRRFLLTSAGSGRIVARIRK
jgi:hypothetical protein